MHEPLRKEVAGLYAVRVHGQGCAQWSSTCRVGWLVWGQCDPRCFCGWWCRFLFGLGRQHRGISRVWECAGGALRYSGVGDSLLHSACVVVEKLYLVVAEVIVQHVARAGRCRSVVGWRKGVLSGILQHASCAANSEGSGEDL